MAVNIPSRDCPQAIKLEANLYLNHSPDCLERVSPANPRSGPVAPRFVLPKDQEDARPEKEARRWWPCDI